MSQPVFLLDTNILSDSSKPRQDPALKAWMRTQERIAIPFPAIVEFQQGIAKIRLSHHEKASRLQAWFEWLLDANYVYPEMTREVAVLLGEMNACPPLKNLWLVFKNQKDAMPKYDLCIAAISIAHGLPIATIDIRDFMLIHRHFRLPGLFNPTTGLWSVRPGDNAADSKVVELGRALSY